MRTKRPRIKREAKVNQVATVISIKPYKLDTLAKITIINRSQARCETVARQAIKILRRGFKETQGRREKAKSNKIIHNVNN